MHFADQIKPLFCFRALVVSANSAEEKFKWMEDLRQAIQEAKERPEDASTNNFMSLKACSKYTHCDF